MVTMMLLALAVTAQDSSHRHVRASESRILALLEAGLSRSATFRRLVATLDASDVIVYIEPKTTRQALGGYLAHNITVAGAYRYLHVAIETTGAKDRLIPLLAHELQHAVEVAQAPEAVDAESLGRLSERLAGAVRLRRNDLFRNTGRERHRAHRRRGTEDGTTLREKMIRTLRPVSARSARVASAPRPSSERRQPAAAWPE